MFLFTVIHVNFSQSVYSAEEADGNMTITLQADGISILPYSVEINPMELMPVGAPGMYVYRVLFDRRFQFIIQEMLKVMELILSQIHLLLCSVLVPFKLMFQCRS